MRLGPLVRSACLHSLATLRRFPLAGAAVLLATVGLQSAIDDGDSLGLRLVLAASFALPGFVAASVWRESLSGRRRATWGLDAAIVLGMVVVVIAWPDWTQEAGIRRVLHIDAAALLAVAALPFVHGRHREAFWAFNRSLFVRFVLASLFTLVLFAGLSLALWALEELFSLDLPSTSYVRLLGLLVTLFHPLYVLAGVPTDLDRLDGDREVPTALRVFARAILAPLVGVYLAILLAYLGRVLLTQQWPSGWIGWLVSAVSVAGLLAVLLLHPLARGPGQRWVSTVTRFYFGAMIPSLAMLLAALGQRIEQYGITENRYLLGALALWLLVLSFLHVLGRWRDPRWIPATLAVLALLTGMGPWGGPTVSRLDQSARLEHLLEETGRLEEGKAMHADTLPSTETREEIAAILRYLVRVHGPGTLRRWFEPSVVEDDGERIDSAARPFPSYRPVVARALDTLGLSPTDASGLEPGDGIHWTCDPERRAHPVEGALWIAPFDLGSEPVRRRSPNGTLVVLRLDRDGVSIDLPGRPAPSLVVERGRILALLRTGSILASGGEPLRIPFGPPPGGSGPRGTLVLFSVFGNASEKPEPRLHRLEGLLVLSQPDP